MRRNLMKNMVMLILIITTIISVNAVSSEGDTHNLLNASDNYTQALENAKIENKSIVLLFDQKSCSWCEAFKRNTLDNEEVVEKVKLAQENKTIYRGILSTGGDLAVRMNFWRN